VIIESSFASITAPKVDILSPGMGRLDLATGPAGHRVKRDDDLFVVQNAELQAELELARARVTFLEASRNRKSKIINTRDVSALDEPQIKAIQELGPDEASIELLEDEISLEMGRVKALELRLSAAPASASRNGCARTTPLDQSPFWSNKSSTQTPSASPPKSSSPTDCP